MSSKNKIKTEFVCSECGHSALRLLGQCPMCKAWNSFQEFKVESKTTPASKRSHWAGAGAQQVRKIGEVKQSGGPSRHQIGIGELDRVLGGGLVQDSIVLLGGDPGIGKSTILLQTLSLISQAGLKGMYISGEESLDQIAQRGERLELNLGEVEGYAENELETILAALETSKPQVVVVDSIQTLHSGLLEAAAGSVSQVRECAAALTKYAKTQKVAIFLVGHVTKDGSIAGPRVLEHLVDTVLYFEGDPSSPYRLIRAIKNRFGPVNELGAFEMTQTGLISVDNPSALFLSHQRNPAPGSCVLAMQDGPRPMLIEIQALLDTAVGNARRLTVGLDNNRVSMMCAILSKHGLADITGLDIFVNAVGGIKITETAADLPVTLAMFSSLANKIIPNDTLVFGELGLTGEVRAVQYAEDRLKEAVKMGFKTAIVPKINVPKKPIPGLTIYGVKTLQEAMGVLGSL